LLKKVKNNDEEFNNLNRIIWENHNQIHDTFNQQLRELEHNTNSEFERVYTEIYKASKPSDKKVIKG